MELQKETQKLLFCMLRKGDWITSEELSRMLNWNKKKVQQAMKWLMDELGDENCVESQKNKGYRISRVNENLRSVILKDAFYNEIYFNLDERRSILIMDLLFRRQYIPMDQLAEDYYLSKSVVFEEIRQMRRWFGRNDDIQLEISPQRGIYIHGLEKDKRFACTAWGPLHILQMTRIDTEAVQRYQDTMEQTAIPLQQLLVGVGRFVSGEEYSFLLRYIAMSRLRSSLGYCLPEIEGPVNENQAFFDALSIKLGYTFPASERAEINRFIRNATILAPKSHPEADQTNLHALEDYLNQKLQLSSAFRFEDPELVAENLNSLLKRPYHRVNYYDKNILVKYPLSIHLVKQAVQKLFNAHLPRTEVLNMAAFLGGYLDNVHYPSNIRILLVGNQSFYLLENLRQYICQSMSFAPERVDYLPAYAWNSELLQDVDYYSVFLTTEPEVALKDSRFRLIPIVMTNENRNLLRAQLDECRRMIRTERMEQMQKAIQYKRIPRLTEVTELLPQEDPAAITTYVLNRNTLCVICTSQTVQTGMDIVALDEPFSYDFREISTVKVLRFRETDPGIIEFFHTAADILQQ